MPEYFPEYAPSYDFKNARPKTTCVVCDHPRAIHIFRNNRYLCLRLVKDDQVGIYLDCRCKMFASGEVNIEDIPIKVA